MSTVKAHRVTAFFVVAFALSWAVWIPMAVAGGTVQQGSGWPSHLPGLLGPAIAAIAVAALLGEQRQLLRRTIRWRVAPVWYLVALSPLAVFAIVAVVQGSVDVAGLSRFSGLPLVAAPVMLLLLVLAAFAEEIGWRGFAVDRLLRNHNLLVAAAVVGVLWAIWHLPLFIVIANYRELGPSVLPMFFLGILSGSVFLAWLYRASGGSILICALWHGGYNLVTGTAAASGMIAAAVSAAVMAAATVIVVIELWRQTHPGSSRTAHSPS